MKKQLFIVSLLVLGTITQINAQQGFGTITPDASAVIDITSTTQGLLMPRMTTVQRTAIATPATGLEVYDTTTKSHWYFDGTLWVENTSGGAADHSDDAWVNATGRIELATQSNGTTARLANTEFVALDNGDVGIGTTSPLGRLEINHIGTAGIIDMLVLNSPGNSGLGRGQRMLFRTPSSAGLSHEGGAIEVVGLGGGENTYMSFSTSSQASGFSEMMRITNTGNVGIGTPTPQAMLEVVGDGVPVAILRDGRAGFETPITAHPYLTFQSGDGSVLGYVGKNTGSFDFVSSLTRASIATVLADPIVFQTELDEKMRITADGNVGIGTGTPTAKLHVIGNVIATGGYADYVLEEYVDGDSNSNPNYSFKNIKTVDKFIKENKHLPGVTPISELNIASNGKYEIDITKLQVQMLEKVEELYLHTISQQNQLEAKEKKISDLETRLAKIEAALGMVKSEK